MCVTRGGGGGSGGGMYSPSMMLGKPSDAKSLKQLQRDAAPLNVKIEKEEFSGRYVFYLNGERVARTAGTKFSDAKSYFNDPYAKHRVPRGKSRPGAEVPSFELTGLMSNRGENTSYAKRGEFARFKGL